MADTDDDDTGLSPAASQVTLDEHGYPLGSASLGGGGARIVPTGNPMQIRMEQQRKAAEEKAQKAAKKAALAGRMSAFQRGPGETSGGGAGGSTPTPVPTVVVADSPASVSSAASPSLLSKPLDSSNLDSRVVGMMKS